jgi:hypothetical protein
MKTGQITIIAGLALVAGGIWFGRALWAAQRGLVTLHVKNAPLAEVARAIEGQVRQKIRVDSKLDGKVTLDVKNMPLANVLDLLAEQTRARWGKTYAVYDSTTSLDRLEDVFGGGATLDAAGWTNVAPHLGRVEMLAVNPPGGGSGPPRIFINPADGSNDGMGITIQNDPAMQKILQDKTNGGAFVMNTEDVTEGTPSGGGAAVNGKQAGSGDGHGDRRVMMRVTRGPGGTTTTMTTTDGSGERVNVTKMSPDGKILGEDDWSPERLVMETPLFARLGDAIPEQATRETAERAAAKVQGHVACYYALDKPPFGGDFRRAFAPANQNVKGGTNNPQAMLEAARQESALGGLGKLTPEQQVRRAREAQEAAEANQ